MGFWNWVFVWRRDGGVASAVSAKSNRRYPAQLKSGERRSVPRFAGLGARVIIDTVEYDVIDWSENSFRISGYDGSLIEEQIVHFRFLMVYREETWEWPGVGRVARIAGNGDVAINFRPPAEPFRTRFHNVVDALKQKAELKDWQ